MDKHPLYDFFGEHQNGRAPNPKKRLVPRYNVIFFDCQWTEIPALTREGLGYDEVYVLLRDFHNTHAEYARSLFPLDRAMNLPMSFSIEVTFVEAN